MKIIPGGNEKLGKSVFVVSRPVGDTCPSDCHFLGNGCYAEFTEKRFPVARKSAHENLRGKATEIRAMIVEALAKNKPIRIHERGDFVRPGSQTAENPQGEVDGNYLRAWVLALQTFQGQALPDIWAYTHLYDSKLLQLAKLGVHLYASVNSDSDYQRAKLAGFTLFAFVTEHKKAKGGSKNFTPRLDIVYGDDAYNRTLVCPEQRLGRDKITCDTCKWCTKGKGNIAFLNH